MAEDQEVGIKKIGKKSEDVNSKIAESKMQIQETQKIKDSNKLKNKASKSRPKAKVSDKKIKIIKDLAEKLKNHKTILLVSVKNLPSQQLQKIKKDLRGKADVKIVKKTSLIRAINEAKSENLNKLKEHIKADMALAFSDEDAFEIAAWLFKNRNPIAARQGQVADDDIKVDAGPTSLVPGPDIIALGNIGLKVAVQEGKISIKEGKVVLKKGEKVTLDIASILQKLEIKPFMIGLNPAVIYDSNAGEIYVGIKIDRQEALDNLMMCQAKALGFTQNLRIITKETIGYLLAKANSEMQALEKLAPKEEAKEEPKADEKKEEEKTGEVKEEPKAKVAAGAQPEDKPTQESKDSNKKDNVEIKSEEAK